MVRLVDSIYELVKRFLMRVLSKNETCRSGTTRGERCKNPVVEGSEFCHKHHEKPLALMPWYKRRAPWRWIGTIIGIPVVVGMLYFSLDAWRSWAADKAIMSAERETREEVRAEGEKTRHFSKDQFEQFEEKIIAGVQQIYVREDALRGLSPEKRKEYQSFVAEYRRMQDELKVSQEKLNFSLEAQLAYAWSLHTLAKLTEAEVAYRSVIEGHSENSAAMRGLGMVLTEFARYEEAEEVFIAVLAKDRESLGEEHSTVAKNLNNLAMLYLNTERIDEAESLVQEAQDNLESQKDPASADTAIILNNYGSVLWKKGRIDEATAAYRRAIEIGERVGPDKPLTGLFYHNLSAQYRRKGSYELAQEFQVKAMSIWEGTLPEQHYWIAAGLNGMGELSLERGEYLKAKRYFERSLGCVKNGIGEDHPYAAVVHRQLAIVLKEMGKLDAAREEAELALQIDKRVFGTNHLRIPGDFNILGEVLRARKDYRGAEQCYRKGIQIINASKQSQPAVMASLKGNLGLTLAYTNRISEAELLLREALKISKAYYGKRHSKIVVHLYNLAAFLADKGGNVEESVQLYEEALRISETALESDHPDVGKILNNLGAIYIRKRETHEKGMSHLGRAVEIFEKRYGRQHPITITAMKNAGILTR